jgi:hypothetical protein
VKELHRLFPDASIQTAVISEQSDPRVVVKATIYIGEKTFTGHSQAEYKKGMMGEVALEVAETSAVGRALGFANIGLLDGIASSDEMRKAGSYPEALTEKDIEL